jgi:hypothetical protein
MLDEIAKQRRLSAGPLNGPLLVLQERFDADLQFAPATLCTLEEVGYVSLANPRGLKERCAYYTRVFLNVRSEYVSRVRESERDGARPSKQITHRAVCEFVE